MAGGVGRLGERIRGALWVWQSEQLYLVLVAVVIGLLGGLGAVGFRLLIQALNGVFWHEGEYTLDYIRALPFWWKLLAPTIGGLIVGLITYHFAREATGHGVPEVMEAVALKAGRIRPRVVLAKMIASGVCIASGGSVGREGPIVQIGSALGSTIGQWIRIDRRRLRTLVGCGAAAGIAGTFNAPIAGALFSVEIILGDFAVAQFSPIVISSVAATVVSQHFLGDFPAFVVPTYSLVSAGELFAYAALGLLAALVAIVFIRSLYRFEDWFEDLPVYPPLLAAVGGTLIGLIGLWLPEVFGVGYEAINEALTGNLAWQLMAVLVLVKILAVSITIGSGGSGGIFAPSLFIGAMLGGAMGSAMHFLWPGATAGSGAYALVGMGAVVAAATHAPITAILIIFELTNEYEIILPLMISCIIATLLSTRLQSASIYTMKLLRRGVDIYRGRVINVLQPLRVREIMRSDMVTVTPGTELPEVIATFLDHPGTTILVADEDGTFRGIIPARQVRPVMGEAANLGPLIIAQDLVTGEDPHVVAPDDSLADVMKHLEGYRGEIPVVQEGKLTGVIWPEDLIERYNQEMFKLDMARSMASAMDKPNRRERIPALQDAAIEEVPVPLPYVGKSLRELDLRGTTGVSVLLVTQEPGPDGKERSTIPTGDYVLRDGDVLLVMGPGEKLREFAGRPVL